MRLALLSLLAAVPAAAQTAPTPPPTTAAATQAAPPVQPIRPSKIILVGDSTTAVSGGWGGAFCGNHVTSFLACLNLARGGRSSSSYRAEGSWEVALAEMRVPGYVHTWVLIQFGHNDKPGKPGRSTDVVTEFPANLRRYVNEARAAGAIPVLVTPLTRRAFTKGRLDHDLEKWAEAARQVARETGTPLVDLNAKSAAAVEAMGEAEADTLAPLPKGSEPVGDTEVNDQPFATRRLSFDQTHLGQKGAELFAAMMARELSEAVPDMRRMLYP